ncbi:gliding motility-associated C-terminal domain-containing protein [Larkinella insperata]|uniref:Gliding motility-associated C-terminal domain-containing protein n=1 Tax=Larkinella insperata TaxID=332158 RepID=A0ABW3Q1P4_9BACT|nr:gliding motility-associated C-terminal domain-containing protein [Larkinella insperata]
MSLLNTGFSQSCTGVLGDAIINETFGTDVFKPLAPGQTTYRFVSDRCPTDGEYILANSSYCYGTNWHTLTEDHTSGDQNGVMLVVNASYDAGEFYSHSVTGLCSGITYEFSVWVLNLMNPIPENGCNALEPTPLDPNITMRIQRADGSVIKTINTGTIGRSTSPTWLRYAILFTMPENESSVFVKLINNGPGGCGNDLALDDIQFRPCHPVLQIYYDGNTSANLEICENTTYLIKSDLGSGYSQPVYQWQESSDGLSWQHIANATQNTYLLKAVGKEQRYYRLVCTQHPNLPDNQAGHCFSVSNTVTITVRPPGECREPWIYVPDAFTPNHDQVNDVLDIYHDETITFELRIFNRWGSVIFITDTNGARWDGTYLGKPCQEGIYHWKINYTSNNTNTANKALIKTGQVLLMR